LKTELERHLKERYDALFQAEFNVLLYDLTSSYVEGEAEGNPKDRDKIQRKIGGIQARYPQVADLTPSISSTPAATSSWNGN
jgi:hypothetical protein